MLRGSAVARIDDKGRLKIPAQYRQVIESKYGHELYVTSLDGNSVRIYPFPVWIEVEQKLASLPSLDPTIMRFKEAVTYFGSPATMDKQGRVLIQSQLRERAKMVDDITILGQLSYLDVWNRKALDERISSRTLTDEDLKVLAERGF